MIERPIGGTQIETQVDTTPASPAPTSLDPGVIVGLIVGVIGALATITGAALSLLPWFLDRRAKRKRSSTKRAKRRKEQPQAAPDTHA